MSKQAQARLSKYDFEHLATTLESGLGVTSMPQFYLWAQGALQGFIPHETVYCAFGDIDSMEFRFETFSRSPRKLLHKAGQDPLVDLLPQVVDDWLRHERLPRTYCPTSSEQTGRRQLIADMKKLHLGSAMAHGPAEVQGRYGSFFLFAGMPHSPGPRDTHMLQLFMPYLHMALYRVLGRQAEASGNGGGKVLPTAMFSKREIQVLHWVKNGKTNLEISQILEISQPTVKCHVQNIMRKLNVTNRAQAVGKSATLRLLVPTDPH